MRKKQTGSTWFIYFLYQLPIYIIGLIIVGIIISFISSQFATVFSFALEGLSISVASILLLFPSVKFAASRLDKKYIINNKKQIIIRSIIVPYVVGTVIGVLATVLLKVTAEYTLYQVIIDLSVVLIIAFATYILGDKYIVETK